MPITRDETFIFPVEPLYSGIRQDLPISSERWRLIQNGHLNNIGAITKDLGVKRLADGVLHTGDTDTIAAIDAHFSDGSQHLIIFQIVGSNLQAYKYDGAGGWILQTISASAINFTNIVPSLMMFADKLLTLDGTKLRTMANNNVWSDTAGDTTYSDKCTFGTVYSNRAVIAGHPTYPFTFFPSDYRTYTWDVDESVDVTSTFGESITAIFKCGQFLIVGGQTFSRAYYLGSTNSKDWDWDELSALTGPLDWKSCVEVSLTRGNVFNNYSFFWGDQGPMMIAQQGSSLPQLFPMWEPLEKAFRGTEYEGVPAIDITKTDEIVGEYVPELREIRFAARTKKGTGLRNILYCLHLPSAIQFAQSGQDPTEAPAWRIRHNPNTELPVSTIFQCQVNPDTGQPDVDGQIRLMSAQNGFVYQMDARATYKDEVGNQDPKDIPFEVWFDGINGSSDGVTHYTKSCRDLHVRASQSGSFNLGLAVTADGSNSSSNEIALDKNLNIWSNDTVAGTWGDSTTWNEGDFLPFRAHMGTLGKKFDVNIKDNGSVAGELQITSLELSGMLEELR